MEKVGGSSIAKGGISVDENTFRWKINNFDVIMKDKDYLKLQKFEFEFTDSTGVTSCWRAWMCYGPPNRDNKKVVWPLRIEAKLEKANNSSGVPVSINAEIQLRVHNLFGITILDGDTRGNIFHCGWTLQNLKTDTVKTLLDPKDAILIVKFSLKIINMLPPCINDGKLSDVEIEKKMCEVGEKHFYGLISELENDEKNSDIKLISNDGQEFFAYRWILSGISDVFQAMFLSNMTEMETGVVKLEDLSGKTVKVLLHFIYTRKVAKEWSTPGIVEELTYAADKYQIQELKVYLDANLGKVCTAENAGNLLELVKKTSLEKAVADILAFIRGKTMDFEGFLDIIKNMKPE